MEPNKLIAALRQIKTLADESLKDVNRRSNRQTVSKISSSKKLAGAKKLSDYILQLKEGNFFKQAKTAKEVRVKLQPIYSCDLNRVEVALLRLQRRKKLRKTSKLVDKKSQIAYVL